MRESFMHDNFVFCDFIDLDNEAHTTLTATIFPVMISLASLT
jgi:hypothetical protein